MNAKISPSMVPRKTYTLRGPKLAAPSGVGYGALASRKPRITAMISALIAWKWTALMGARVSGETAANQRGSRRTRPMANSERVAAVAPELALAIELLRMANTTSRPP